MDPLVTIIFVLAFLLFAIAAFGGRLGAQVEAAKAAAATPLSPNAEKVAALFPETSMKAPTEPHDLAQIPTWKRFQPILFPVGAVAVLGGAGVASFFLLRGLDFSVGDAMQNSLRNSVNATQNQQRLNLPEMKGVDPVQFKMPDPPKIAMPNKR